MDANVNCENVIYSDDYVEFILDYRMDTELMLSSYYNECTQRINENYVVAYARKELFDTLSKNLGYRNVPNCYGCLDTEALSTTGVLRLRRQPFLDLMGQGIIVGIVDTGIDYLNDAFVWEDGRTKIVSAWVQEDRTGKPPEGFLYGREYTSEDINTAIRYNRQMGKGEYTPYEEDVITNIRGLVDANGHGTMMAALSAGRDIPEKEFSGAAPFANVAVVKLRKAKRFYRDYYEIKNTAEAFLESDIMLGIRYLLRVSVRENKPLVICLGIGTNQGDHNGTGPLAEYINSLSGLYGIYMCAAAGNETGRKHHFRGKTLVSGEYEDVSILVNDNQANGGFVAELWASSASFFSVRLKPPIGDFTGIIDAKGTQRRDFNFQLAGSSAEVYSEIIERSSGDQLVHFRIKTPAPGIWTIRVIQESNVPGRYDIWLPMENFAASDTEFIMPDPDVTICEPANATGIITMGGCSVDGDRIYVNSSRGYTRNGLIKPDLVCPAEDVYVIRRNNSEYVTGTSVASAITGGILALFAEWSIPDRPTGTIAAKEYLIRGADTGNISVPDKSYGYGVIDIYSTFVAISE